MRKSIHRMARYSLISLLISLALVINCAAAESTLNLAPMLSKVTPTVVNISVEKVIKSPLDKPADRRRPMKLLGVGSGVVINAQKGYIVTNAHVVAHAKLMLVTLKDGRRYFAKKIGESDGFDIAVIQIQAPNLTALPFADSSTLKVGNYVAAIGSPFGLSQTVTSGMVSALNRIHPKIEGHQSFIQTDAPINPGNSGGALVNLNGKLVGINTAIVTSTGGSTGIGFAIPSNMVKHVVNQLIKYGNVKRGMLGVIAQNITKTLSQALKLNNNKGTLVTKVVPNSPANKAGIEVQDVITKLNNAAIRSATQLSNMLAATRPGTKVKLTIVRAGKPEVLTVTVGDPKKVMKQRELPFLGGLQLSNFSELKGNGKTITGVKVNHISATSAAALAGVRPGDVILSANGDAIESTKDLAEATQTDAKQLLLKVARGKASLYLVIPRPYHVDSTATPEKK